jgi:hypothetical protein
MGGFLGDYFSTLGSIIYMPTQPLLTGVGYGAIEHQRSFTLEISKRTLWALIAILVTLWALLSFISVQAQSDRILELPTLRQDFRGLPIEVTFAEGNNVIIECQANGLAAFDSNESEPTELRYRSLCMAGNTYHFYNVRYVRIIAAPTVRYGQALITDIGEPIDGASLTEFGYITDALAIVEPHQDVYLNVDMYSPQQPNWVTFLVHGGETGLVLPLQGVREANIGSSVLADTVIDVSHFTGGRQVLLPNQMLICQAACATVFQRPDQAEPFVYFQYHHLADGLNPAFIGTIPAGAIGMVTDEVCAAVETTLGLKRDFGYTIYTELQFDSGSRLGYSSGRGNVPRFLEDYLVWLDGGEINRGDAGLYRLYHTEQPRITLEETRALLPDCLMDLPLPNPS